MKNKILLILSIAIIFAIGYWQFGQAKIYNPLFKTATEVLSNQATYIVSTDINTGDYIDIQSAINALPSTGGKIFVKAGTYTITSSISIGDDDITIEGEGSATSIQFDGSIITNAFQNNGTTKRSRIKISNLEIKSTSSGNGVGIRLDHWKESVFEKLHIVDVNGGIYGSSNQVFYNDLEDIVVEPEGTDNYGFKFDSNANDNVISSSRVIPSTTASTTGFYIDSSGIFVDGSSVEKAWIGIDIGANGYNATIRDTWLESNWTNLQLANGVETILALGNHITLATTTNILDNGARGFLNLSQTEGDPLFFYGGTGDNNKFGIGTTTPTYNVDIYDSTLLAMLRIDGAGAGTVQSAIRLDADAASRGSGIFIADTVNQKNWYFGTPYSNNDAFVINRRSTIGVFNTDTANYADADVKNVFMITSTGNIGISTTTPQSLFQIETPLNASSSYLQLDVLTSAPAAADCNAETEIGRMIMASTTARYIWTCWGTAGWATSTITF